MAFISTVPVERADGAVRAIYEALEAHSGYVPNYAKSFSHRPEVYNAWAALIGNIRTNLDQRRYELVTLAAAKALGSSYCMLAHGSILLNKYFQPEPLARIADDYTNAGLPAVDVAIMSFAEKIVRDATSITESDVQQLYDQGLSDAEIFDVASTAAARCFFSKLLDSLGTEADVTFSDMDEGVRDRLTIGRPISTKAAEHIALTPA